MDAVSPIVRNTQCGVALHLTRALLDRRGRVTYPNATSSIVLRAVSRAAASLVEHPVESAAENTWLCLLMCAFRRWPVPSACRKSNGWRIAAHSMW